MTRQDELKQQIIDKIAKEAILMAADQVRDIIQPEAWDKMPKEDRGEAIKYLAEAYAQGALRGAIEAAKAKMDLFRQDTGKE